jgi:alkylhydroperoxidase family enzyme
VLPLTPARRAWCSGDVTDEHIDDLREHGYTDEQIAEVVGVVALQLLTRA